MATIALPVPACRATAVTAEPAARWRVLGVLAAVTVLAMASWFSSVAVLPALRGDAHFSDVEVRAFVVAVQLGFALGGVVSAWFAVADRVPARSLVFRGALAAAVANALPLLTTHAGAFFAARFAVGFLLAFVFPALIKTMATWFRADRGVALAALVAALTVGSASPHLVNAAGGSNWRAVLAGTSLLCAAGAVIGRRGVVDGPFAVPPRGRLSVRTIPVVMRERGVALACTGYFGHMWELYAGWAAAGVLMGDVFRSSRATASLATFTVLTVGALGCWYGAWLGARRGKAAAARVSLVWSGSLIALLALAAPARNAVVVVLFALWSFWAIADSAQLTALVSEHADPERVGTALTVQLAVGFCMTSITMWLVPMLHDAHGWGAALALLVPGPVVGAIAMRRLEAMEAA
jgi:MFS family permease